MDFSRTNTYSPPGLGKPRDMGVLAMRLPALRFPSVSTLFLLPILVLHAQDIPSSPGGFPLEKGPGDPTGRALFDTASSFLNAKCHLSAVAEFQKFFDQYPESPLAAEALYKRGIALLLQEQSREAS